MVGGFFAAILVLRFFPSSKGFILAGPVAKGAKTARESAIEYGREERILTWDTRLKVEYCVSISRGSPALLVKTATISYHDILSVGLCKVARLYPEHRALIREGMTFMRNQNGHVCSERAPVALDK